VQTESSANNGELPLTKDKVTLTFATHQGSAGFQPPSNDLPFYQQLEKLTNVHIEFQTYPFSSYDDVIKTRMAANSNLPDIVFVPGTDYLYSLGRQGVIVNQTDMLKRLGYYTNQFFAQAGNEGYKNLWTTPEGKFFGVSSTVLPHTLSFGYNLNLKWLKKLNLKQPETTDELYSVLVAFRDKDPNGNQKKDEIPLAADLNGVNYIANSFGLELWLTDGFQADGNGKIFADWTSPRYKEFLTYMNKLYAEGLLDHNYAKAKSADFTQYVSNDKVGIVDFWTTFSRIFSGASPLNEGDNSGNVPVFVPMPPVKGPHGDRYNLIRLSTPTGTMAITSQSKNKELAFKWIDFLFNSPQVLDLTYWGIEGVTYRNDNGQKTKIESPGQDWGQNLLKLGGGQQPFAQQQSMIDWKQRYPDWVWDYDAKIQPYYKMPSVVDVAFTAQEQEDLKMIQTDMKTYNDEMQAKFINGTEPLANFDKYAQALKSMGIDKVIQIYQQRYDRYVKLQK
jgi:putative aldouronate transport system substrate-binding protein